MTRPAGEISGLPNEGNTTADTVAERTTVLLMITTSSVEISMTLFVPLWRGGPDTRLRHHLRLSDCRQGGGVNRNSDDHSNLESLEVTGAPYHRGQGGHEVLLDDGHRTVTPWTVSIIGLWPSHFR